MITQIDHVVIPCADLGVAADSYRSLGFAVTEGGRHQGLGTRNMLIEFPRTFLELVGVADAAEAALAGTLDRFEQASGRPVSYLLRTTDVVDDLARLRAAGFATDGPTSYRRRGPVESSGEFLVGNVIHGGAVVLTLVQPGGRSGARRAVAHPNGAFDLVSVSFAAESRPDNVCGAYEALGVPVDADDTGAVIARVGTASIRLDPGSGSPARLEVAVHSIDETAARLRSSGVAISRSPAADAGEGIAVGSWRGSDLSHVTFVQGR